MTDRFEPMQVYTRHASAAIGRCAEYEARLRTRACAMIAVRHATPMGEALMVASFPEIAAMLREMRQGEMAAQLMLRESERVCCIVVVQDLHHAPALIEVPIAQPPSLQPYR